MAFVTKIDLSNNRQVKQYEYGDLILSGSTTFGIPYTGMTTGINLDIVIVTSSYTPLLPSTFTGNSSSITFDWVDTRMSLAANKVNPITALNSGATQSVTAFTQGNSTVIDGNPIVLNYTGITFDLNVDTITSLGNGSYSGTLVTNQIAFLNADSYDYKDRRIWVDVRGITRSESLILTNNPIPGYVLTCLNENGDIGLTAPSSGVTGGTSEFITGFTTSGTGVATLINKVLNIPTNLYTLPIAQSNTLGGIMIGGGLSVDSNGVVSITGSSTPTLNDVVTAGNTSEMDIVVNGINIGLGWNNIDTNLRIGKNALGYATSASTSIAIGSFSQQNARITNANVSIGYDAMSSIDTTSYSNSIGAESLSYLIDGDFDDAMGAMSQQFNLHGDKNASMGYKSLQFNVEGHLNTSVGYTAGRYIQSTNTTAIGAGAFSGFYDNVNTTKLFDSVDIFTDYRVTVTGHNFATAGKQILLRYTNTSGSVSALVDNEIYLFTVIDDNTLYNPIMVKNGNVGSGRLTAQYTYLNSTAIGANSMPTQSNQIVLGDTNVTQTLTYGNILSKIGVLSSDPTSNEIPSGFLSAYKNTTSGENNLWVNDNGVLKKIGGPDYTLSIASSTTLGGIKIGGGLSIDGDGVVSAINNINITQLLTAIRDTPDYKNLFCEIASGCVTIWVADVQECEKSGAFSVSKTISGLGSPSNIFYDIVTNRAYVCDTDNSDALGNIYWFDPTTATTKSDMVRSSAVMQNNVYNTAVDPIYRRIYMIGRDTNGLISYDIETNTKTTVAYGTNGVDYNRVSLTLSSMYIYASDTIARTLTIINRSSLATIATRDLTTVPSPSRFSLGNYGLAITNNEIYVYAGSQSTVGTIGVYSLDLLTMITEITLPGAMVWTHGNFWQSAFYDKTSGHIYVWDYGSNKSFIIDTEDYSIIATRAYDNRQGKTNSTANWAINPITNELLLSVTSMDTETDSTPKVVLYIEDRVNYTFSESFKDVSIPVVSLVDNSTVLLGATSGLNSWSGVPGYDSDGKITFLESSESADNTTRLLTLTLKELDYQGVPTGNKKANLISDQDYIAPVANTTLCPLTINLNNISDLAYTYNSSMSTLYYEFDIPKSVSLNTSVSKIKVSAYDLSSSSVLGVPNVIDKPSVRFISGNITSLAAGSYSIQVQYLDASSNVLATWTQS